MEEQNDFFFNFRYLKHKIKNSNLESFLFLNLA